MTYRTISRRTALAGVLAGILAHAAQRLSASASAQGLPLTPERCLRLEHAGQYALERLADQTGVCAWLHAPDCRDDASGTAVCASLPLGSEPQFSAHSYSPDDGMTPFRGCIVGMTQTQPGEWVADFDICHPGARAAFMQDMQS